MEAHVSLDPPVLLESPQSFASSPAHPVSGASGISRKESFSEKHLRQWGVTAVSATKCPIARNLAWEAEASGEPHFQERHTVDSPILHKWVFPEVRWET